MAKLYTKNTWQDEVLAGDEAFDLVDENGAAVLANVRLQLKTPVLVAGSPVNAERMNNVEAGLDSVDTSLDQANTAIGVLQTSMATAQNDIDNLEAADISLDSRLDTVEPKVTTLEGKVATAETNIGTIQTQLGVNPQGSSANVAEKIAGLKTTATGGTIIMDLQAGGPKIGTLNYSGTQFTMNDDTAIALDPGKIIGVFVIAARGASYKQAWAIGSYRVGSGAFIVPFVKDASVQTTVGTLTGTTGADGFVTIGVDTVPGKFYIENRLGMTISINFILLGE